MSIKNIPWKKSLIIVLDVCIMVYLVMAFTTWNKPAETDDVCTKVDIRIADEGENGFLNSAEVKSLLEKNKLYPLAKPLKDINPRLIEEELTKMPFVNTAQCYTTQDGHVRIIVTQRTPIIRVKSARGDDYYIDDNGGVMPNSQYTSDMIIVTGDFNRAYACKYLSVMARVIMDDDLWKNQIEQINVLPDKRVELVPRVGEHIVNIGELPGVDNTNAGREHLENFVKRQLERLQQFYKKGLSLAGWNKYDYISLEYSNQIVCRRTGTQTQLIDMRQKEREDSVKAEIEKMEPAAPKPEQDKEKAEDKKPEKPASDNAKKPAPEAKKPVAEVKKPVADAKKPASAAKKPDSKPVQKKK